MMVPVKVGALGVPATRKKREEKNALRGFYVLFGLFMRFAWRLGFCIRRIKGGTDPNR